MNINYHVLKLIESNPEMTQRELASELDVSLGKVNYCLKAMVEKGWIKVQNFKKSNNKLAYLRKGKRGRYPLIIRTKDAKGVMECHVAFT